MADKGAFNISVGVVDSATSGLKKINAQLAALQKPYKDLNRQVSRFSDLTGITKVTKGLETLGRGALSTARHIGDVALSVAGLGGIATIGGIATLTEKWSDWGNSVQKTSDWLGISTTKVLEMSNMSKMLGAGPNAMAESYEHVADMARNARLGIDQNAVMLFGRLGITSAAGQTSKAMDQIIEKARELKKENRPDDVRALYKAFGLSPDLIRAIETTTDSWDEMEKKAKASAEAMAKMQAPAVKFHDAMASLGVQLEGVLATALTPFATAMSNWLSNTDNQQWIIDNVTLGIKHIKEFITESIPKIKEMWTEFKNGEGPLNKIVTIFEVLGGLTLASWTLGIVRSFTSILGLASRISALPWLVGILTSPAGLIAGGAAAIAGLAKLGSDAETPENRAKIEQNRRDMGTQSPTNMPTTDGFDAMGRPIPDAGKGAPTGSLSSQLGLKPGEYETFRDSVAKIEHANYNQMGGASGRFAGRYQMGADEIAESAHHLGMQTPTQAEFLNNPGLQDQLFEQYTKDHDKYLESHNSKYASMTPEQKLSVLAYAHNQGAGGASKWVNTGQAGHDAFGTSGTAYSDLVNKNLADQQSHLHVTVEHKNPPPGTTVVAKTTGPAFNGPPPKVMNAMPALMGT